MEHLAASAQTGAEGFAKEEQEEEADATDQGETVVAFEWSVWANNARIHRRGSSKRKQILPCDDFRSGDNCGDDGRDADSGMQCGQATTNIKPPNDTPGEQERNQIAVQ